MASSPLEEYSNAPVPGHRLVPGWRLALIVATFSISLPTFLSSASIALPLGLYGAVLAALVAGLILSVGGCFTSIVSVHSRLTTYLLVQRSFGMTGAALVNLVIALVHFGWFGVNVSFFAGAMVAAVHDIYGLDANFDVFVVAGSLLIAVSTIFGFRTLDRLAWVAIPLLSAILIGVCAMAVQRHGLVVEPVPHPPMAMSFGTAVSAIVGGNILVIAAMPDLSRYVRTTGQAVQSMTLSLPVALTLMMLVSAIPALAMGETDIMRMIVDFGFGAPALAMLVLSIWTLNAANLYSASLSLSATFPAIRPWIFTIVGGVAGGALALAGIINAFVPFLLLLGMIIPPIAAIYVIDGLTIFRRADAAESIRNLPPVRWPAVAVWIGSVAVALLADRGVVTLTTVPALDASLVATGAYLLVRRLQLREKSALA
jgi:cytosine permease